MGRRAKNKQSDPEPFTTHGDNRPIRKRRVEDADSGRSLKKLKSSTSSREGKGNAAETPRPNKEAGKKPRKKDAGFDTSEDRDAGFNHEDDGGLEAHRKLVPQARTIVTSLLLSLTGFCLMRTTIRL